MHGENYWEEEGPLFGFEADSLCFLKFSFLDPLVCCFFGVFLEDS